MVDVYSDANYANGASLKSVYGMGLRMHGTTFILGEGKPYGGVL